MSQFDNKNQSLKKGRKKPFLKSVLASALSLSLVLGSLGSAAPAFAAPQPAAVPVTLNSGKIQINLNSASGPGIRMNRWNGNAVAGQYNYGPTSNTFRIITGQALEVNQANRPKPPQDPHNLPDWDNKTAEEQAQLLEDYQLAQQNHAAALDAYFKSPDTWKKPEITLNNADIIKGAASNFTLANTAPGQDVPGLSYVFDPGAVEITKDQEGKNITLTGKAKGNANLDVELTYETVDRNSLDPDDVTNIKPIEDRATYLLKVTNTSQTEAQVFGTSWNVDTYIVDADSAPFRGPGINKFSSGNIAVGFPTKIADELTNNLWTANANSNHLFPGNINSYVNKVPEFIYAQNNAAIPKVAIIYPKAEKSRKYPNLSQDQAAEQHFEDPDYLGVGHFAKIASTSDAENGTNFFWHALSGIGNGQSDSADSGHIVRYNPRVVLPGETKYFGVTYGEAEVDEKSPNGPYLLANNPKLKIIANDKNEYEQVSLDLLYGNNAGQQLTNAKIKMYLPVNYLVADKGMETNGQAAEQWVKGDQKVTKLINGKNVECYVWTRELGTVPANFQETSVNNIVVLNAYPQTASRSDGQVLKPNSGAPTSVVPVYAFELEYNGTVPDKNSDTNSPVSGIPLKNEYKYTHKDVPVEIPFVNPVNLYGKIWRDVNGDKTLQDNEGKVNAIAKVTPGKDGEDSNKVKSVYGGGFAFKNGYVHDKALGYELAFEPENEPSIEKYIWEFDETFNPSAQDNAWQAVAPDVPIYAKYINPDGLKPLFENLDALGVDQRGNSKLNFKVKSPSADGVNLSFRVQELLAGKITVYPYFDENNNNELDSNDTFITGGTYRLGSLRDGNFARFFTQNIPNGQPGDSYAPLENQDNKHKVVAFRDYKAQYKPVLGYRYAANGLSLAEVTRRNAESVLKSPEGSKIPIQLVAKDVRFAGPDADPAYPAMNKEPRATLILDPINPTDKIVQLQMNSSDEERDETLVFNAWDGKDTGHKPILIADLENKRSELFNWEVISDPQNILVNEVSADGKVKIKAKAVGSARIKVSFKDTPNISNEMILKVANPITGPGETISKFEVESIEVEAGKISQEVQLFATIQKAGVADRKVAVLPSQLEDFKAANPNGFSIHPEVNIDTKKFKVVGLAADPTPYDYSAVYDGQPIRVEGTVKVLEGELNPANYKLVIEPSPIKIKQGETQAVKYFLQALSGSEKKPADNVAVTLSNANVTMNPDHSVATGASVGKTELTAKVGSLVAKTQIEVYDDATAESAADGKILFEEVTSPKTNGFIPVNGEAKYKAYIDLNNNGRKDTNERYLKYDDVVSSISPGANLAKEGEDIFKVTGTQANSQPELLVKQASNGKLYIGKAPIVVMPDGQTLTSLELTEKDVIVKVGARNDSIQVKAKFSDDSTVILPRANYTVALGNNFAKEYGNTAGNNIKVEGVSVGITPLTVTLGDKTAEGKVVVIPENLKVTVEDTFVKVGATETPKVGFTGDGLTQEITDILTPLVTIRSEDPSVLASTPDSKEVTGQDVGKAKIVGSLPNLPTTSGSGEAYIYEENKLLVEDVTVGVGDSVNAKLFLTKAADPTVKVSVPAKLATVKVVDTNVAKITPSTIVSTDENGSKVKGNNIDLTGVRVGSTKLKVTIKPDLASESNVTVSSEQGNLVVTPMSAELYKGDTVGLEIVTKDRVTGAIIPVTELDYSFTVPGKNKIELRDGKAFLLKDNDDVEGDNTLTVKTKGASPVVAGNVSIKNNLTKPQSPNEKVVYELAVPNFVMYMGQPVANTAELTNANVKVIEKVNGQVVSTKPISDYGATFTDLLLKENSAILSGAVERSADSLTPGTGLFRMVPTKAGSAAYRLNYFIRTPEGVKNLEAVGNIAIFAQDPTTVESGKLIVTTPVPNVDGSGQPNGSSTDQEVDYTQPLPSGNRQDTKLVIKYPDGTEQIISGDSLPAFVGNSLNSEDDQFEVAPNGELVGKTSDGTPTKVKGGLITAIDPVTGNPTTTAVESPEFRLTPNTGGGGQPQPPTVNGDLIVEPKSMVVVVGKDKTIDVKIKQGSTLVAPDPTKLTFTPNNANVTVASDGTVTGVAPGNTTVKVDYDGRYINVAVTIVDDTNGNLGIEEKNPTTVDPNESTYPGGFIVPGEVIKVPVGGNVPFKLNLNGFDISGADVDVNVLSGNHSNVDLAGETLGGNTVGVDKVEFSLKDNPNIKKVLTVVVYDNAANSTIEIVEKPSVFRENGQAQKTINSKVDLAGSPNATVLWLLGNTDVASFGGENTKVDPASNVVDRNVVATWEGAPRPNSAKLIAIVLESGKQDSTMLLGEAVPVDGFEGIPDSILVEKDVPKTIDEAFSGRTLTLIDQNGNRYATDIRDFDLADPEGPVSLSGADNRIITATDRGDKKVYLVHRSTGVRVPLVIKISDDANEKVIVSFDPASGSLKVNNAPITGKHQFEITVGEIVKAQDIPTAVAPSGYKFVGWKNGEYLTRPINQNTEFTAIYAKNDQSSSGGSSSSSGGGGGGGGGIVPTPQKPNTGDKDKEPVKTPDVLNAKVHFAYVLGYPDGNIKPNNKITRGEVASIYYRLLIAKERDRVFTSTNGFKDVEATSWYNKAVSSMSKGDYVSGYLDNTFGAKKNITRAEFVAITARFMKAKPTTLTFKDVSDKHWAKGDIQTAVAYGWVSGYEDGTFRPDQEITRAEAMAIINRLLDRGVDENGLSKVAYKNWPDNKKGAWYYYEVIEATNSHKYEGKRPNEVWTSLELDDYVYDIDKYERPSKN